MKRAALAVSCVLLGGAAGCGQSPPKPSADARLVAPRLGSDPPEETAWTPSLVEDGSMFRDEATFREYVRRSDVVAVGILTSWNGGSGNLRVERVLRGRADSELSLTAGGGIVRVAPSQRVIALLSTNNGRLTLNSFCAASGLYRFTERLFDYVNGTLQGRSS